MTNEESFVAGNVDQSCYVRGVDVMALRDGPVAARLFFVKG